jgi:hypothetical protein
MRPLGHFQTKPDAYRAAPLPPPSFDHLVRAQPNRGRHLKTKRLRSLEIDRQAELGQPLNWQIGRVCVFEDPCDVSRRLSATLPAYVMQSLCVGFVALAGVDPCSCGADFLVDNE